jgi:alpha-galactosidase
MRYITSLKRRQLMQLVSGVALGARALSSSGATTPAATPAKSAQLEDAAIRLQFDRYMRTSITCLIGGTRQRLTGPDSSEFLQLADGRRVDQFTMRRNKVETLNGPYGAGRSLVMTGVSSDGWEKTVRVTLFDRYPGCAVYAVAYRNVSSTTHDVKSWTNHAFHVQNPHDRDNRFWSYSGASYPDRRDWVQPVKAGFTQPNFMGMSGSDYGSGTPVVDVWRRDCGLAVGHLETVPKQVSLPIRADAGGVHVAVSFDQPGSIKPGDQVATLTTFVTVHKGDYFATLDNYRRMMADLGLHSPPTPAGSYEPIWCAWGYERKFSMELVEGTLQKAKDVGLDWAVIDDGWQTANGDWYVDKGKFPRGEADLKRLVGEIRAAGLKPRLWFSPLAVDPGSDLLHDHTDMLLLDKNGAVQNISWWNSFYLCPAYQPTIDYTKALVRKMIGEWDFDGLKIDGQHLNGVAPCYNPKHNHARPEESIEKLSELYHAMYAAALEQKAQAVMEICPCGTSYAFFNMPYMNQAPASDPESSWQVRHKGKTLKALMGPSAPYSGDHVELSDGGDDFASTVGLGAVVSTKFTWPVDPKPKDSFLLTPEKERLWRKWIGLYKNKMLPTGTYRGELYDIGFDVPETHVVEREEKLYFAFYAKKWNGMVSIRGLRDGEYTLHDYFNDKPLGKVSHEANHVNVAFDRFLLLEAIPIGLPQQI